MMKSKQESNQLFKKRLLIILCIIFSGICWYFSTGLTGNYWYLLWIAPVPVIYISLKTKGKQAFFISFIAYLIGRLNWAIYFLTVGALVPAIIFPIILSLLFALTIILARKAIIKTNAWYSMFAFPVFVTAFEFIVFKLMPDGSAGSLAYTQSNVLPIIQIASITGILGISFIVTFIPSAIALCWLFIKQKSKVCIIAIFSSVLLFFVLLFGILRINGTSDKNTIKVGLVVLEKKFHDISKHPNFLKDTLVTQMYVKEIAQLATQGAKIVVLSERAININKETENVIIGMLGNAAKQNKVYIIAGYTNFRNEQEQNSALVINDEGKVVADYCKAHLVPGLESRFMPGNEIGIYKMHEVQMGISICKDLDFPDYIKKYAATDVAILTIPAWDFGIDDWFHSRMAIMRSVENGFAEIRTARGGCLTISNCFGHVNYESNCSKGQKATLLGEISLQKSNTIYTRFGDNWFGFIILIAALVFGFVRVRNKNLSI